MEEAAWWLSAACRGISPAEADEVFFPSTPGKKPTEANNKYCSSCPVMGLCLDSAILNNLNGFWAGTSDSQRSGMNSNLIEARRMLSVDECLPISAGRRIGFRQIKPFTEDHAWMDEVEPDDTTLMLMDVGLVTVEQLDKAS